MMFTSRARAADTPSMRCEAIGTAAAEARDEITRTDAKASTLLTLATGALAGLVTFARAGHVPLPATAALWSAAALATAAMVLLLRVVRPHLGKSRRGSVFADHERLLTGACVQGSLDDWQAERLRRFSALAVAKHRQIRRGVDLLFISLALLAVAAVITAI